MWENTPVRHIGFDVTPERDFFRFWFWNSPSSRYGKRNWVLELKWEATKTCPKTKWRAELRKRHEHKCKTWTCTMYLNHAQVFFHRFTNINCFMKVKGIENEGWCYLLVSLTAINSSQQTHTATKPVITSTAKCSVLKGSHFHQRRLALCSRLIQVIISHVHFQATAIFSWMSRSHYLSERIIL